MIMPTPASSTLAIVRARHHLDELHRVIDGIRDGNGYRLIHDYQPNSHTYTIYAEPDDPPLDDIAVLVGDSLYNLNAALNFLVYEASVSHTNPLPHDLADGCQFPIVG